VTGIEPYAKSAEKAKERLISTENATIVSIGFESYESPPNSFDLIVFVASMHHMEHGFCMKKAERLLKPNGMLLVVGCFKCSGMLDLIVDIARLVPARIGSMYRGEVKAGIDVMTKNPETTLKDIKKLARKILRNAKIRHGLYYRYLLSWTKPK
jgi:SAM-dependent methyltransferase